MSQTNIGLPYANEIGAVIILVLLFLVFKAVGRRVETPYKPCEWFDDDDINRGW